MAGGGTADHLPKEVWLLRPCEIYKEEYNDCKGFLSRIYQYYIDGTRSDCTQWLSDYKNCMKFRNSNDLEAAEAAIESERQRRNLRLQNARGNDIWEYRKSPPPEWSAPLNSQQESSTR